MKYMRYLDQCCLHTFYIISVFHIFILADIDDNVIEHVRGIEFCSRHAVYENFKIINLVIVIIVLLVGFDFRCRFY